VPLDSEYLKILKITAETALATAQACLKIAEQLQAEADENKYVSLETAAIALGEGISTEMLKDRCVDGRFRHGLHFINSSDGKRGNYLIKVSAVKRFFETDPAKRVKPKHQ
jgi:hypothetical protein